MDIKRILRQLSSPPMEVVDSLHCEEVVALMDLAKDISEWHKQTVTALRLFQEGTAGHDHAKKQMSLIEAELLEKVEELYIKSDFLIS